ncbi:MAG: phage/plasmid primase, P4 family [Aureliella sp.]
MITKGDAEPTKLLLPHHEKHLAESGLKLETIQAAGIYSETNPDKIRSLIGCAKPTAKKLGPVIVFPFYDLDGRNAYARIRPDAPRVHGDRKLKYESPKGQPNQVYLPPGVLPHLDASTELIITEGEKKSLAATQAGFPTLGLVGVYGWKRKAESALLPTLERINWKARRVVVAFDSDIATNPNVQDAEKWLCHHLAARGADVKVIRLPSSGDGKTGLDDYLLANGPAKLRELLDNPIDPQEIPAEVSKLGASMADPAIEAERMLAAMTVDGLPKLRFWSGSFWWWSKGRYREVPTSEVRAQIVHHLNKGYSKVGISEVSNTLEQIKAQSILYSSTQPPSWLKPQEWAPEDIVATTNSIVHLPSYVDDKACTIDATPAYFTTCAVDYKFEHRQPDCPRWKQFLSQLWPNDPQSIELLQDWFGYSLTPDTRHQKILMIIGPRRSGKGTIARIIRGVVGEGNVCGPTLASLQTNFGLWPLLGRTLAVISDARLSGRSDQAVITERLLSISGEDAQTVDRKNLEPVTTKLLTRFMIISNELPRLQDASGALAGRMLILRLTESFYGREDRALTEALQAEKAGILHWAIEGWKRLRERGYFIQPDSSDQLREQLDELSSPIAAFVNERCDLSPSLSVEVPELYNAWKDWCEGAGREPGNVQTFGRDLLALCSQLVVKQHRMGAHRQRKYEGIGLIPF